MQDRDKALCERLKADAISVENATYSSVRVRDDLRQAAARLTALAGALQTIADGEEPRPVGKAWMSKDVPNKNDKCIHDRWMYEDCGQCVAEFARAALATPEAG